MANDDLPLKLQLTRLYNSLREWILADVQQIVGKNIVGGKVVGSQISGTIPSTSVPYSGATPASVAATATVGSATSGANHADHQHAMGIVTSKGDLLTYGTAPQRHAVGTNAQSLVADSAQADGVKWADQVVDINFVIDGGGSAITTGTKGYLQINQALTITANTLLADQSGSIVVNIWKCTYSQFDAGATHPVSTDKITASAPPTISSATKSTDSTLTGWTTSISAGDVLAFHVDSVTSVQRVTTILKCTKA